MRLFIYLLLMFLFFSAFSGGKQKEQQAQTEESQDQPTQTESEDVRTIKIIGVNQMKYVVKEDGELIGTAGTIKTSNGVTYLLLQDIKAEPGEKLRIRLTTVSNLPASAMSHNWIL